MHKTFIVPARLPACRQTGETSPTIHDHSLSERTLIGWYQYFAEILLLSEQALLYKWYSIGNDHESLNSGISFIL